MTPLKYIVRHGSMRFLGEYEPPPTQSYERGHRVVVRSERGLEVGEVLCEANPRAVEMLDEAATEARRIDASGPERPRAFVAITAGFLEADPTRAWEMLAETIKAANAAEGFTGDDSRMSAMLRFKQGVVMNNYNAPDFDLLGIFRALAKADLYRAIDTAKGFTGEASRANATLAIARAVLEKSSDK